MSVLTKVFVVLVTLLSVLLVALIVPFVANTENFRSKWEQTQRELRAAEAKAANAQAEVNAAQQAVRGQVSDMENKISQLTSTINTLQAELADVRAARQRAATDLAKLEADVSRFSAAADTNASLLDATRRELSEWRDRAVDADTKLIQRGDRINQLESANETLSRSVDRLREQMTLLQERSRELEDLWNSIPREVREQHTSPAVTDAGTIVPETPIRGRVTKVEQLDDTTFVQVNIGTNDGVRQNMKFYVHKDNQYLGTLVISAVDANAAAGRVTLATGRIGVGDTVYTGGF